jgi:hypothetical protein
MTILLRRPADGRVRSREAETIRAQLRTEIAAKRSASATTPFVFRYLWAVLLSHLSATEKLLALALLAHADRHGESAHPGQNRLGALVDVSNETIRRATRSIEAAGLLETITGKGKTTTKYFCRVPAAEIADPSPTRGQTPHVSGGQTPRLSGGIYTDNLSDESSQGRDLIGGPSDSAKSTSSDPVRGREALSRQDAAREVALRIKRNDGNHIFADTLFTESAYAKLADVLQKWGVEAVLEAASGLIGRDRSGNPMRRGHIRAWDYLAKIIRERYNAAQPVS